MSSFGEGVRKEAEDKHRKEREKELAQVTHSFVLSISQNSQFYCQDPECRLLARFHL
jgi:hypothetical protein